MIVYEVFDGDEYEVAFPTRAEAIAAGKANNATVTRISLPPVNRQLLCDLLNREGYAVRSQIIYQPEEGR